MKLGKKPAQHRMSDLLFEDFRKPEVVFSHPKKFGHPTAYPKNGWGMLGNDRYGDCVWAGAAHETMLWNKVARSKTVQFSTASVLSDYSKVTGFDHTIPDTDQGTDVHDALNYRRRTGIIDDHGTRHRIGAYVSLEPGNWEHVLDALYMFGAVGIGFECPSYIFDEFDKGRWSVRAGATTIEGGHYVPLVGFDVYLEPVSWAKQLQMTKGFFTKFCDEAYGILSLEDIQSTGRTIEGFDLAALQSAINAL